MVWWLLWWSQGGWCGEVKVFEGSFVDELVLLSGGKVQCSIA